MIRIGTHQADLRVLRAIPRVGEKVDYGHIGRGRDTYVVESVIYVARSLDDDEDLPETAPGLEIILRDPDLPWNR